MEKSDLEYFREIQTLIAQLKGSCEAVRRDADRAENIVKLAEGAATDTLKSVETLVSHAKLQVASLEKRVARCDPNPTEILRSLDAVEARANRLDELARSFGAAMADIRASRTEFEALIGRRAEMGKLATGKLIIIDDKQLQTLISVSVGAMATRIAELERKLAELAERELEPKDSSLSVPLKPTKPDEESSAGYGLPPKPTYKWIMDTTGVSAESLAVIAGVTPTVLGSLLHAPLAAADARRHLLSALAKAATHIDRARAPNLPRAAAPPTGRPNLQAAVPLKQTRAEPKPHGGNEFPAIPTFGWIMEVTGISATNLAEIVGMTPNAIKAVVNSPISAKNARQYLAAASGQMAGTSRFYTDRPQQHVVARSESESVPPNPRQWPQAGLTFWTLSRDHQLEATALAKAVGIPESDVRRRWNMPLTLAEGHAIESRLKAYIRQTSGSSPASVARGSGTASPEQRLPTLPQIGLNATKENLQPTRQSLTWPPAGGGEVPNTYSSFAKWAGLSQSELAITLEARDDYIRGAWDLPLNSAAARAIRRRLLAKLGGNRQS